MAGVAVVAGGPAACTELVKKRTRVKQGSHLEQRCARRPPRPPPPGWHVWRRGNHSAKQQRCTRMQHDLLLCLRTHVRRVCSLHQAQLRFSKS